MARVLVSEEISDKGLDLLREAGHEVDVQIGLDEAGLAAAIVGAQAIIIRSATTVSAELLSAGTDLKIVGRAGIGLDNVDVDAATERNVLVANAPFSNAITAAEHTMAMLLASVAEAVNTMSFGRAPSAEAMRSRASSIKRLPRWPSPCTLEALQGPFPMTEVMSSHDSGRRGALAL